MISKISEYSGKYLTDFSAFIRCNSGKKDRPIWQTVSYFTVLFPLGAFFVWAFSSTVKSLCGRISSSQGSKNPNSNPSSTEHKTNNAFSKTIPLENGHISPQGAKELKKCLEDKEKELKLLQAERELRVAIKNWVENKAAKELTEIQKKHPFPNGYISEYMSALKEATAYFLQQPEVHDPICTKDGKIKVVAFLTKAKGNYIQNSLQNDRNSALYMGHLKALELLERYCLQP